MIPLLSRSKIILFVLLCGCNLLGVEDPVEKYNKRFLVNHYKSVKEESKKHKKIALQRGITYSEPRNVKNARYVQGVKEKKIANSEFNYIVFDRKEYFQENKDISILRNFEDEKNLELYNSSNTDKLVYLQNNFSDYSEKGTSFEDIYIPRNSDSKFGKKAFVSIDYLTMQESFDYLYVIRLARIAKIEQLRRLQEAENKKNNSGVIGKTKKTLKNIRERIGEIIK